MNYISKYNTGFCQFHDFRTDKGIPVIAKMSFSCQPVPWLPSRRPLFTCNHELGHSCVNWIDCISFPIYKKRYVHSVCHGSIKYTKVYELYFYTSKNVQHCIDDLLMPFEISSRYFCRLPKDKFRSSNTLVTSFKGTSSSLKKL